MNTQSPAEQAAECWGANGALAQPLRAAQTLSPPHTHTHKCPAQQAPQNTNLQLEGLCEGDAALKGILLPGVLHHLAPEVKGEGACTAAAPARQRHGCHANHMMCNAHFCCCMASPGSLQL